jgi:conjugal transfer ATP-binding protein TraC
MSYQIPQQLKYSEKIMFGLTFKQLSYAFIFGVFALIMLRGIKHEILRFVFASIPCFIGICFMFFNFDAMLKDYWVFLRSKNMIKGSPKLERFIGVKEIRDNLIINSKNKKIAILKIRPINFSIKQKDEKDSIMYSFQKFLNSLDFPTQILMNTESIELGSYLDSLESRIKENKFKDLFSKYKKHLQNLITNDKIMNRVFYLVIPEKSNIDIQVDICHERLLSLKLKSERVKNTELKKLLMRFFSAKGKGEFIESISPDEIKNNVDYLEIDGKFHRIVYAHGYPRSVEAGFLDKIVSSLGDFDLSIHINPYQIENMLIDLNKELQKQRSDLFSMQSKGIMNPSLEIQYKDTKGTLNNLQKGKERLFNLSLYVTCKADSLDELNLLSKKIESELNSIMILPRVAQLRMLQGFKSTAPLGIDELKIQRDITTHALSAFFPFTSQFMQADNSGVWLGMNKNNIPIIKDIFNLPNPNGLVLAQSGGGKSYFCKLLITRYLLNGTKVMVIDPQGEYRALVGEFKGQLINLSRTSNTIINPLDLMGHDYTEKRLSLMDLMRIMLGDLSEIQRAFIDKALTITYEKHGINQNPDTWGNTPPILGDLLKVLERMEKDATHLEKTTLRSLINRLAMYVTGVFSFFNQHTNIDFNNRFVCFDIGNMPSQVKPSVMFLVLDYIYMKMKSDLERKILLIDESWSLLSRTEEAGYIFEIVKTCRKFNLGLLLINQEVEGLLDSKAGKSVLANSAYTLLMRQKPAVIDNICKTFHLSESEKIHLLTANVGEGLLIMEDDHSEIKVIASPEEHKVITTKADEINKTQKKIPQGRDVKIGVDEFQRFFRKSKLSKDEVKFLLEKGYKIAKYKRLASNKKEEFLLKPRHNESIIHFFVTYDIKEYLESKGIKVKLYVTKKPDVVFEFKNKKWAIEIETGTKIKKDRKMILDKVKYLKKNYDKWFFVITNNHNLPEYKKVGETIELRSIRGRISKILQ